MPCYHPLHGWKSKKLNATGKRSIVFKLQNGLISEAVSVPCGKCIGCRLEYSRQWAMRCLHEAQLHQDNCFLTLTYSDEHLPPHGTLHKPDFQKFMKRLRFHFNKPQEISFYHCGEYGETTRRPHYHALIFGADFYDRQILKRGTHPLYESPTLQKLWPFGHSTIGDITFESAAYCARYVVKKINGQNEKKHYEKIIPETGEIITLQKEYSTMSLKQPIGKEYQTRYATEINKSDSVIMRGREMKPPRYYDKRLELTDPSLYATIKAARKQAAADNPNNTTARLKVRETVKLASIQHLKRTLE